MGEPELQITGGPERTLEKTGYPRGLIPYLKQQVRSDDAAEEIAQEAVVRYVKARERQTIENPASYIFRVALRLLKKFRSDRARSRSLDSGDSANEDLARNMYGSSTQPEDRCLAHEQLERMLEAIRAPYRQALWMHKVEGKSIEEIATALNISPDSVFVYIGRALSDALKSQK